MHGEESDTYTVTIEPADGSGDAVSYRVPAMTASEARNKAQMLFWNEYGLTFEEQHVKRCVSDAQANGK